MIQLHVVQLSRDRRFLASCSHDNTVKLWNVAYLFEADGDVGESFKAGGVDAPSAAHHADADVDADMMSDDSDDSDDSDEDDAPAAGGAGGGPRSGGFFSDL